MFQQIWQRKKRSGKCMSESDLVPNTVFRSCRSDMKISYVTITTSVTIQLFDGGITWDRIIASPVYTSLKVLLN